jgi:hypothetical protein
MAGYVSLLLTIRISSENVQRTAKQSVVLLSVVAQDGEGTAVRGLFRNIIHVTGQSYPNIVDVILDIF